MNDYIKKILTTLAGGVCIFLGLFFILLPGPAVIFLPLGLALLSLEYVWAKVWLRKVQKWFRVSAVKADQSVLWLKKRLIK